jgi:hypothetical protein
MRNVLLRLGGIHQVVIVDDYPNKAINIHYVTWSSRLHGPCLQLAYDLGLCTTTFLFYTFPKNQNLWPLDGSSSL